MNIDIRAAIHPQLKCYFEKTAIQDSTTAQLSLQLIENPMFLLY